MINDLPPLGRITLYLALMSLISFGGIPSVLPDIRDFVVITNSWLTDRDFTNYFALAPGAYRLPARPPRRAPPGAGPSHRSRNLLAPVYGWFTEGFNTLDLKDA